MLRWLIFQIVLLIAGSSSGQIDWMRTYGRPATGVRPGGMLVLNDTTLATVAGVVHPATQSYDLRLRTHTLAGTPLDTLWSNRFPEAHLIPWQLKRAADGAVWIAALRTRHDPFDLTTELVLLEWTPGSPPEPRLIHPFPSLREPARLTAFQPLDPENGWLVAVQMKPENEFSHLEAVALWRFDAAGVLVWEKRFRNPDSPGLNVIHQIADGTVYAGGEIRGEHYLFEIDGDTGSTRREWALGSSGSSAQTKVVFDFNTHPSTGAVHALLYRGPGTTGSNSIRLVRLPETGMELEFLANLPGRYAHFSGGNSDTLRIQSATASKNYWSIYDFGSNILATDHQWAADTPFPLPSGYRASLPGKTFTYWLDEGYSEDKEILHVRYATSQVTEWLHRTPLPHVATDERVFGLTRTRDGYLLSSGIFSRQTRLDSIRLHRLDRAGTLLYDSTFHVGSIDVLPESFSQSNLHTVAPDTHRMEYHRKFTGSSTASLVESNFTSDFSRADRFGNYGFRPGFRSDADVIYTGYQRWVRLLRGNCCEETPTVALQQLDERQLPQTVRYLDGLPIPDRYSIALYNDLSTESFWLGYLTSTHADDSLHLVQYDAELHPRRHLRVAWSHGPLPSDSYGVEERDDGLFFIAAGLMVRPEGIFERTHPDLPIAHRGLRIGRDLYVVVGTQRRGASDDFWIARFRPTSEGRPTESPLAERLAVHPNPTMGWVRYRIPSDHDGTPLNWLVLDPRGRIWRRGTLEVSQEDRWHQFDLTDLPPGTYWLHLKNRTNAWNAQFVKIQ